MQKYTATQINSELFSKFPKFLSLNSKYADLTNDDRVAYMYIKERYSYALMQGWIDEKGNVFVYYTVKELMEMLHVKKEAVRSVKRRLEEANLIEVKKQGFNPKTKKNDPDKIYLLQPEYSATDLISQSSQVSALQQSGDQSTRPRHENEQTPDNKGSRDSENCNNHASALQQSGDQSTRLNKDNPSSDTILDTIKDTDPWDLSTKNYSAQLVEKQNYDLMHNLGDTLTNDNDMFLDKETLDLIGMWFRTPAAASECISTILNAANDSRKNAEKQIGSHRLYFEDYQGELKYEVRRTFRRCLNRVRADEDKKDKIKNFKGYLYKAMLMTFDKWQNDVLQSENEENNENGLE